MADDDDLGCWVCCVANPPGGLTSPKVLKVEYRDDRFGLASGLENGKAGLINAAGL